METETVRTNHSRTQPLSLSARFCKLESNTTSDWINRMVKPIRNCITFKSFRYLPFPKQALVFTCLQYKSFENTVGKGEITHNEQFLLFPQCFLPVWITICHFHYNLRLSSYKLFQFVRV